MPRLPVAALPTALAAAGVMSLIGCLYVPTPTDTFDHGHDWVATRADKEVKPNRFTRDEVIARLGKPDVSLCEGRVIAYTWSTIGGAKVIPLVCMPPGESEPANDKSVTHFLLMEFDAAGTLRKRRVEHGGTVNVYATGIADAVR